MSRVIRYGQTRFPTIANGGITEGYIGFWPGFQSTSSTSVTDLSEQDNHLALNSISAATCFASTGGFAVTTTSSEQVSFLNSILLGKWAWNATRKHALFISFQSLVTFPVSSKPLCGNGTNAAEGGIKLLVTSGGATQWVFYDGAATTASSTVGTTYADWDTVWHTRGLYLNPVSVGAMTYDDGIPKTASLDSLSTIAQLDDNALTRWIFGGTALGTAGVAATFRGVHMLYGQSAGALGTDNPDALAMRLHRSPITPVTAAEWS